MNTQAGCHPFAGEPFHNRSLGMLACQPARTGESVKPYSVLLVCANSLTAQHDS